MVNHLSTQVISLSVETYIAYCQELDEPIPDDITPEYQRYLTIKQLVNDFENHKID